MARLLTTIPDRPQSVLGYPDDGDPAPADPRDPIDLVTWLASGAPDEPTVPLARGAELLLLLAEPAPAELGSAELGSTGPASAGPAPAEVIDLREAAAASSELDDVDVAEATVPLDPTGAGRSTRLVGVARPPAGPGRGPSAARAAAAQAAVAAPAASRARPLRQLRRRAAAGVGGLAAGAVGVTAAVADLALPSSSGRRSARPSRQTTPSGERTVNAARSVAPPGRRTSPLQGRSSKVAGKATTEAARPRIDPRFRARWVTARRQEGQRRLRLVVALGIVLAAIAAVVGALHTPWLSVRHVRATGTPDVPAAVIAADSGLAGHPPLVDVDTGAIRTRLLRLPWVATATVDRSWPSTVAIAVSERRAVAVVAAAGGAVLVDTTGRVLGPAPAGATLPTLGGAPAPPAAGSWLPGSAGAQPRAAGAVATGLEVASALPSSVAGVVRTITVAPSGDVTLALTDGTTTVDLGTVGAATPGTSAAATLAQQAGALAALAPSVDLHGIARVDLTVPARPALTPIQAGGTVSTTSRG